jgi:hypothetical protein
MTQVGGSGKTFSSRRASCYQPRCGVARWVLQIDVCERGLWRTTFYDCVPLPAPAWGTSAWRLTKAEAKADRATYDVLLSDKEAEETCSCPWGSHKPNSAPCAHRASLRALIAKGKLPKPAPKTVHVPATLDGKPTAVPASIDPKPAEADPGYQSCDECGKPADRCACELVLAPAVQPAPKPAAPKLVPVVAGVDDGCSVRWDDL